MYIKVRSLSAICHFSLSVLSGFSAWLLFQVFGDDAWRLFPTWVMLGAAIYYCCAAIATLLRRRRESGRVICPTMQGAIIIAGFSLAIFRLVFSFCGIKVVGLEGAGMVLVDFALPIIFFLDWLLFTKKGSWRMVDPLYWLALPICYACYILVSAEFISSDMVQYPYGLLDFYSVGLEIMLSWFALIAVLILILGYICVVIDFVMSGKLAKYVVLPHIKTIVIEEEIPESPQKTKHNEAEVVTPAKPTEVRPITKAAQKPTSPSEQTGSKASRPGPKSSGTAGAAKSKTAAKPKSKSKSKKPPVALLEAHARSTTKKNSKTRSVKQA